MLSLFDQFNKNMSFHKKIALLQQMVNNATSSLRSAQSLLDELVGTDSSKQALDLRLANMSERDQARDAEGPVYEGVFDGEKMVTADDETFPVPANYASKSKLIAGDELKLIITDSGQFIYKQIGPVERKPIVGTLVQEDNRYKVLCNGRAYNVLLAAVTYYKAEVGDKVTIIVPVSIETDWAAIDNVLPGDLEEGSSDLDDDSVF